jgi:plasmid stabilization system protein ParE
VVRGLAWTEAATRDLEAAVVFIAEDSPRYALAIYQEAKDAARSLKRMAQRGRVVPELSRNDIREIFVHRYRLIYQVTSESVVVLAFIHGSRDFATAWKEPHG